MNTPLQKFKYIKGDVLIGFLMDRFDYTAKQAKFLEKKLWTEYIHYFTIVVLVYQDLILLI